jgi:hypothetical protein
MRDRRIVAGMNGVLQAAAALALVVGKVDLAPQLAAAAIGLIAGVGATAYKSRKALEHEYDIDLRKTRIEEYRSLWKSLQPLARYSPPGDVDASELRRLAKTLRRWYFEHGGLFFSEESRDAYFDLQETIKQILARAGESEEVDPELVALLFARSSALRTALTSDVATRSPPRIHQARLRRRLREWVRRERARDARRNEQTADAISAAIDGER